MTATLWAALVGGLALALAAVRAWWRHRQDARAVARLELAVAARTGERDVAAAQATANAAALTRNHAAVEVAAAYRAEVDAEIAKAPGSPVDAIRAADRVRAKILRRRGGR